MQPTNQISQPGRKKNSYPRGLLSRIPVLSWLPKYSIKDDLLSDMIGGSTIGMVCLVWFPGLNTCVFSFEDWCGYYVFASEFLLLCFFCLAGHIGLSIWPWTSSLIELVVYVFSSIQGTDARSCIDCHHWGYSGALLRLCSYHHLLTFRPIPVQESVLAILLQMVVAIKKHHLNTAPLFLFFRPTWNRSLELINLCLFCLLFLLPNYLLFCQWFENQC